MSATATATVPPIRAVFLHLDSFCEAIAELKHAGFREFMSVTTPMPRHEVEDLMYEGRPSPVRWFTMFGGMFGATMAFSLASMTHANWPMIIPGGKPLVSVPPFLVITFEGTILWGSLFTLVGLILNCRLPAKLPAIYDEPRFTSDAFGIILEDLGQEDEAEVRHILAHAGAHEVIGGSTEASAHA